MLAFDRKRSPFFKLDTDKTLKYYSAIEKENSKQLYFTKADLKTILDSYKSHIDSLESQVPVFYINLYSNNLTKIILISLPLSLWSMVQLYRSLVISLSPWLKKRNINIRSVRIREASGPPNYEKYRMLFIKCYRMQLVQIMSLFLYLFYFFGSMKDNKLSQCLIIYFLMCIVSFVVYITRLKKLDLN